MKIAIISDIHGNHPALQAVLKDIENEKADTIHCLGDLVGYYCMINEVIETIRDLQIKTIVGNHDYALLHNGGVIERSKTCTRILSRQLTEIKSANLNFLKNLEESFEFKIIPDLKISMSFGVLKILKVTCFFSSSEDSVTSFKNIFSVVVFNKSRKIFICLDF